MIDGANYTAWDSGITFLDGEVGVGANIKIESETSPGQKYPLKFTEFDAPKSMAWVGGLPLGLFEGVRSFTMRQREMGPARLARTSSAHSSHSSNAGYPTSRTPSRSSPQTSRGQSRAPETERSPRESDGRSTCGYTGRRSPTPLKATSATARSGTLRAEISVASR